MSQAGLALKAKLLALVGEDIGLYTLSNGYETAACAIRAQGDARAAGTKVTGVEMIIDRDPLLEPVPQYQDTNSLATWRVFLVDWSGADRPSGMLETITRYFGNVESRPIQVREFGLVFAGISLLITTPLTLRTDDLGAAILYLWDAAEVPITDADLVPITL